MRIFGKKSVIKIIYYMMSADGRISEEELGKFEEIGLQVDEQFGTYKEALIEECDSKIAPFTNDALSRFRLEQAVADELKQENTGADGIGARSLMWNVLILLHSDGKYDEAEKNLVQYMMFHLNMDEAVILEMNAAIDAIDALEREQKTLQQSQRTYAQIAAVMEENEKRKNAIIEGIRDLIGDEAYLDISMPVKSINTKAIAEGVTRTAGEALNTLTHASGSIKKKFGFGFKKKASDDAGKE